MRQAFGGLLLALITMGCGDETSSPELEANEAGPELLAPADSAPPPETPDPDAATADPDQGADPEPDAAVEPDAGAVPDPDAGAEDPDVFVPPENVSHPVEPPPLPEYSGVECPVITGGLDRETSLNVGFATGENARQFRFIIPENYDPNRPTPLIFGWHWLNASSNSFLDRAELATATSEMDFIAVLPDALENDNGDNAYIFNWPFAEVWGAEQELLFFEDLLACVAEQYNVDRTRIYGIGVSAGALWVSHLSTTEQAKYFAALESLSGGLGEVLGAWEMMYAAQPRKTPVMVLWGGMSDWLGLSFHEASIRYRDALIEDGHFVVECVHDAGHGIPPVEPPPGVTKFRMLWRFMLDHPYGLDAGDSPYLETGLPDVYEDWCRIP